MSVSFMKCKGCGDLTKRECGYCDTCEYMTVNEVLARLRIAQKTYYRWVAAGMLHPKKSGWTRGRQWIARAEVDALLEGRKYTPPEPQPKPLWNAPNYPLAR